MSHQPRILCQLGLWSSSAATSYEVEEASVGPPPRVRLIEELAPQVENSTEHLVRPWSLLAWNGAPAPAPAVASP